MRDHWVRQARAIPGLEVLTPDDTAMHGAITSFRLNGATSPEANAAITRQLLDRHRIFTVHRTGVAKGACVRVTPFLFTSMADIDHLVAALRDIAGRV
ncbi:hypothetical protein [Sphingomonas sp. PB1R3]|uniref:hypothetical protein n=1 Tax=Sphingomonas flavida TaxID=3096154 RepID=UPI003FA6D2EF